MAKTKKVEESIVERLYRSMNCLVTLDDGREAVFLGSATSGIGFFNCHLMFPNGASMTDVEPERVVKIELQMPDQRGSKPKPWPAPWQAARDRLIADVREYSNKKHREARAEPLPPATAEVQALIDARLAAIEETKRRFRVDTLRAWRCRDAVADVVAESTCHWKSVFEQWAWLKAAEPDAVLFFESVMQTQTFHADAREVKRCEKGTYRHVEPERMGEGWEWPLVLEFDASYDVDEVFLELLAAGRKVTVVERPKHWTDPPKQATVTRYVDVGEARAAFRQAWKNENRQLAIASQIAKKGAAKVLLPGFDFD